jgi:hypothetical protein
MGLRLVAISMASSSVRAQCGRETRTEGTEDTEGRGVRVGVLAVPATRGKWAAAGRDINGF